MKSATKFALALAGIALVASGLQATAAKADSAFVSDISWSTLYAKTGDGIVEQNRNIFDAKGVLQVDDSTQHPLVWVRIDVTQVTVQYNGGAAQANKQIQFVADNAGQKYTFADDISAPNKIVTTDSMGAAKVTYTVTGIQPDNYLRVGIADCDYINNKTSCPLYAKNKNADLGGPLIIQWEKPGYYPIIKLDLQNSARDVYWDLSEFKNSWVGERSHVYIKTYPVGATIKLPYIVSDIWGAPIADYPINMVAQSAYCGGNIHCKWANTPSNLSTDAEGKVTFTEINKNTPAEACKNIDPTTKKRCGIGANFQPTTNQIPESSDIFWPQFVNSMTMNAASISYRVVNRGGVLSPAGNDVTVNGVVNPPLPLSSATATSDASAVKTVLSLSYLYNNAKKVLERVPLYAPDVTVTASPGAYVLRVCPDTVNQTDCHNSGMIFSREVTGISQMSASQTFGYTYPATLMFVSTAPGTATFTVKVGNQSYVLKQDFGSN